MNCLVPASEMLFDRNAKMSLYSSWAPAQHVRHPCLTKALTSALMMIGKRLLLQVAMCIWVLEALRGQLRKHDVSCAISSHPTVASKFVPVKRRNALAGYCGFSPSDKRAFQLQGTISRGVIG